MVMLERKRYSGSTSAYLRMLISPQMVVSLETSPISMKYLHNCTCTTAARYQQILERISGAAKGRKDQYLPQRVGVIS